LTGPLSPEEVAEPTADIKEHGQREPIYTYQGKIIDGHNRYRAYVVLGIEPKMIEWSGTGSLPAFVISENVKRRHLTNTQLLVIAEASEALFAKEAKKRQATGTGGKHPQPRAKSPQADNGRARDKAAKVLSVRGRAITDVKAIKKAALELVPLMRDGKLTMQECTLAAKLPAADLAVIAKEMGPARPSTKRQ
jgi:hypothetical protein